MKIQSILISVCFSLFFFACKKYSEGGSNINAKSNLLSHEGKWRIAKYEVNGLDSILYLDNTNTTWGSKGGLNRTNLSIIKTKSGPPLSLTSNSYSYLFSLMQDKLIFYSYEQECPRNTSIVYSVLFMPENSMNTNWNIIKLTEEEIELKCSLRNTYLIKLSAVK